MSCYICFEKGNLMKDKGCACKGSIHVHTSCFQKWITLTDHPFKCPNCKTHYTYSFLIQFMKKKDILDYFHGKEKDEDEGMILASEMRMMGMVHIVSDVLGNTMEINGNYCHTPHHRSLHNAIVTKSINAERRYSKDTQLRQFTQKQKRW